MLEGLKTLEEVTKNEVTSKEEAVEAWKRLADDNIQEIVSGLVMLGKVESIGEEDNDAEVKLVKELVGFIEDKMNEYSARYGKMEIEEILTETLMRKLTDRVKYDIKKKMMEEAESEESVEEHNLN